MTTGFSGVVVAATAGLLVVGGQRGWAAGMLAGWIAGSLNAVLLARRVSLLTGKSNVSAFLYGMASRFALVGAIGIIVYRLLDASLVGFAAGLATVILMGVPVTVFWSMRRVTTA
jgi:hypothetical protein